LHLAIDGLSDQLGELGHAMVYAVAVDQQAIRYALVAHTLDSALQAGRECLVYIAVDPVQWLRKAEITGVKLQTHVRSGRLRLIRQSEVSSPPADATLTHPVEAARRLHAELRHHKIAPGSLVVFETADPRLPLADPGAAARQASALIQWAQALGACVLLLFTPRNQVPREYVTLRTVAEAFGGFSMVRTGEEEALLDVRHWFSEAGVSARSSYVLSVGGHGRLSARSAVSASRLSTDPAAEVMLATRRAGEDFPGIGAVSQSWRLADSLIDAIDKSRSIQSGTLVLHFDRLSGLRELAQCVATIRSMGRVQVRIVVREAGARLRLPQMVALLRLGVSMFIPREVPGASARLVADSLRGTLFTRPFETDVDKVLRDTISPQRGMLGVVDFRTEVERLLALTDELEVPSTLIRFTVVAPAALKAASGALQRGARDAVCTEHDGCIWSFLFGCPPDYADAVMARLLGARFENLLAGWQRVSGTRDVLRALHLLDTAVLSPDQALFGNTLTRADEALDVQIESDGSTSSVNSGKVVPTFPQSR
jgi:hypothetical protein